VGRWREGVEVKVKVGSKSKCGVVIEVISTGLASYKQFQIDLESSKQASCWGISGSEEAWSPILLLPSCR
jgi:hypothetical protein